MLLNDSKAEVTVISQPGLKAKEKKQFDSLSISTNSQVSHNSTTDKKLTTQETSRIISEFDTISYFKKLLKRKNFHILKEIFPTECMQLKGEIQ